MDFQPGFRCSGADVLVLLVAGVTSAWLWPTNPQLGFVAAFVTGHFFLFCNVFRISRVLELIWAAVFVGLSWSTMMRQWPGWRATVAISLFVTVSVVLREMRKPSYHGVAWQRVNPGLREWWDGQGR